MGRRRLYCATLRACRTKRLDQRHEIAQDRDEARDVLVRDRDIEHFVRDETLLVLETVSGPRPQDQDHIPVHNIYLLLTQLDYNLVTD